MRKLLVTVAVVASSLAWAPAAPAPAAEEGGRASGFKEVARLPLMAPEDYAKHFLDRSGWLVLDPKNRFGYQIFEAVGNGGLWTQIQSFDLDTLKPIRSARIHGIPVTSGISDVGAQGFTARAGEVVHAVDEDRGRLYLAMSEVTVHGLPRQLLTGNSTDGQRPLSRFVMIDEAKFNSGANDFAASFREPLRHAPLHFYNVLDMTVSRHHVAAEQAGRLLVTFAYPAPGGGGETSPAYPHVLAQWDPENLGARVAAGQEDDTELTAVPLVDATAEERVLDACSRATMGGAAGTGQGMYRWAPLATAQAVWVTCQSSSTSGAVAEVPLAPGGRLENRGAMRTFPLGKHVADVLVDEGRGRLLLRAVEAGAGSTGSTVWVFDTAKARYTGAVALKQEFAVANSLGLDPGTGRLYALVPDHASTDQQGNRTAVRGGIQISDTRLDPAPPLENVAPELAYNGVVRIGVDPHRRRVFVRRGHATLPARAVYPETQQTGLAPTEDFFRVFEDRIPVAEQPRPVDDSGFTTDTDEGDLATASYLGSGSGHGARSLLVGGLDATTSGVPSSAKSHCGKDDRELVAGSVGQAMLSDLSAAASAAALEGDAKLASASPDLVDRCRPDPDQSPETPTGTEGVAFDEVGPDGTRTGANHYEATCLDDDGERLPPGFRSDRDQDSSNDRRHDDGFGARVRCRRGQDRVEGEATGAMTPTESAGNAQVQVTVGHAHSEVHVTRRQGEGIEVRVDSVARDVDIAGVGSIAVVRTEAVARATGRRGTAEADFERTICGVVVTGRVNQPGCLGPDQQEAMVEAINAALGTRGRAQLRRPDPGLLAGSVSGYRAGVQRHPDDLFEDRSITKDNSAAVPALELMFFQGDGDARWGAGRQVVQLASAQASASYGIACRFGQRGDGRCAAAGEETVAGEVPGLGGDGGGGATTSGGGSDGSYDTTSPGGDLGEAALPSLGGGREGLFTRLLRAPVRALAEAFGLLFNNPRELGLLAAVWLLLYAPFHLGERQRTLRRLRSRRPATGGAR